MKTKPRPRMELSDAMTILVTRIQDLYPELGQEISESIILEYPDFVMEFASAPTIFIQRLAERAIIQLGYTLNRPVLPFSPNSPRPNSTRYVVDVPGPSSSYRAPRLFLSPEPQPYNQVRFNNDQGESSNGFPRSSRARAVSDVIPTKTCHYFSKGFCRHGNNCRYVHDNKATHHSPSERGTDDFVMSCAERKLLDFEIRELLKSREGTPIPISSLPMLYHETYLKSLQAFGYLTERRRQGRAGYSLTKLLGQLKSIRVIERAHGQHDVILAEDALEYNLKNGSEKKDPGEIVKGSDQIFMTFPPESTFSDEDIAEYFSNFGTVVDVRIPCLRGERMFGFVTFTSPEGVSATFASGHQHWVRGCCVRVKPYRDFPKPNHGKCTEKCDQSMPFPGNYLEAEHEHELRPIIRNNPLRFNGLYIKDQEQDLEMPRGYHLPWEMGQNINGNGNGTGNDIFGNDIFGNGIFGNGIFGNGIFGNGNGNDNGMGDLSDSDVDLDTMSMKHHLNLLKELGIDDADETRGLSIDDSDNNERSLEAELPESSSSSAVDYGHVDEDYFK